MIKRKRNKDIFWALILIAIAIGILGVAFGYLTTPTTRIIWSIVLGVFGIGSLIKLNWFGFFIIAAIIIHINKASIGVEGMWPIYFAAILLAIGLQIITGRFTKKGPKVIINGEWEWGDRKFSANSGTSSVSGDHIMIENNFSDQAKYVHSDKLQSAQIENNFGGLKVYFDQAQFSETGCTIHVENNFGKTSLFLPRNIRLDNQLKSSFGNVYDENIIMTDPSFPIVVVKGDSTFGSIDIHYV